MMQLNKKNISNKILDERYEIKKVLEAREESILYEGWHQRLRKKVLITEINSDQVDQIFEKARRLGDFSDMPGIFQVSDDQFEEKNKGYMISQYPIGTCLKDLLSSEERVAELKICDMFGTLLNVLDRLQKAEICELPVDPEHLYIQEDGSLWLWPDLMNCTESDYVYEVCAIIYQCLTGIKPPDRIIRILIDEMETLEKKDPKGSQEFHAIVEKGLQIDEDLPCYSCPLELEQALTMWKKQKDDRTGKKRYFLVGGMLLLFLLVGTILFGFYCKYEEDIYFLGMKTETFILTPSDEMSRKEYIKAISVVRDRVKKLSGKQKYRVRDDDGNIKVILNRDIYSNEEDKEGLEQYLSMPLRFTLFVGSRVPLGFRYMEPGQYEVLEKEDIQEVEEVQTKVAEHSLSMDEIMDKALKVTLTDDAAARIKDKFENQLKEDKEVLLYGCMDVEQFSQTQNFEVATYQDSWKEIVICENSRFQRAKDFLKKASFTVRFEVESEINAKWWKRYSDKFTYWVAEDKIGESAVKLEYKTNIQKNYRKGKYYHDLIDLAGRLELLKIPYAIGTSEDNEDRFVVKVRQKDISDFLAHILAAKNKYSIEDNWGNELYVSDQKLELRKEKDGSYRLIETFRCRADDIREFVNNIKDDKGRIYLKAPGGYRIAEMKLEEIPEPLLEDIFSQEYQFAFDKSWLGSSGEFSENMQPVFELLGQIGIPDNMTETYDLCREQYSTKNRSMTKRTETRTEWETGREEWKRIKKKTEEEDIYTEVKEEQKWYRSDKQVLNFILHMDTSEDYSKEAVKRAKNLWKQCDLEYSQYDKITFYIGEEYQFPYIVFSKVHSKMCWGEGGTLWDMTYTDSCDAEIKKAIKEKAFGVKTKQVTLSEKLYMD